MPRTKETVVEEKLVTEEKTKKVPVLKICPVNPERFESPTKGTEKASCYDIYLQEDIVIPRGLQNPTCIKLGLKMEIPKGHDIRLYLRSSVARDLHLIMGNAVGIIDEDFRGELTAYVYNLGGYPVFLKKGQRVFQFELQKKDKYHVEFVSNISEETKRGDASGSTGR